jgi:hypothetical protein
MDYVGLPPVLFELGDDDRWSALVRVTHPGMYVVDWQQLSALLAAATGHQRQGDGGAAWHAGALAKVLNACADWTGREAGHCEGEPRTPPPGPQQVAPSAVLHSHPGAHKHGTNVPTQGSNSQSSQGRFGGLRQGERPHQGEVCHQDDIRRRLGG